MDPEWLEQTWQKPQVVELLSSGVLWATDGGRGQATCIVTSGGEPKGAEVGLRLNLRLLGNIGDQSSSGLMGRPTFLVGAPTIDDQTAATCKPLCTRLWAWPANKRSVVCKVKAALLGVIKRGELWSFDCSLVNWLINKFLHTYCLCQEAQKIREKRSDPLDC